MHATLLHLFRFKAWADDELLTRLAALDGKSLVIEAAMRALSHSYAVDRIFAAHLRGQAHAYASANPSEIPPLDELAAAVRHSDREYVAYVTSLRPADLAQSIDFTFTDGAPGRMTREEILMHVITHGVGHRGQVSAVMLLKGLPAARDGFTTYLHLAEPVARRRSAG